MRARNIRIVLGLGVLCAGLATGAAINRPLTAASRFAGIQKLQISASGPSRLSQSGDGQAVLRAGERIELVAEGAYGTQTIPVRARWQAAGGGDLGKTEDCDWSPTCSFTAGTGGGDVTLRAEFEGASAAIRLRIDWPNGTDAARTTVSAARPALLPSRPKAAPRWATSLVRRMLEITRRNAR